MTFLELVGGTFKLIGAALLGYGASFVFYVIILVACAGLITKSLVVAVAVLLAIIVAVMTKFYPWFWKGWGMKILVIVVVGIAGIQFIVGEELLSSSWGLFGTTKRITATKLDSLEQDLGTYKLKRRSAMYFFDEGSRSAKFFGKYTNETLRVRLLEGVYKSVSGTRYKKVRLPAKMGGAYQKEVFDDFSEVVWVMPNSLEAIDDPPAPRRSRKSGSADPNPGFSLKDWISGLDEQDLRIALYVLALFVLVALFLLFAFRMIKRSSSGSTPTATRPLPGSEKNPPPPNYPWIYAKRIFGALAILVIFALAIVVFVAFIVKGVPWLWYTGGPWAYNLLLSLF